MLLPGSAFSQQLQPHWTSCPDHPSHIHTVTNAFGNHMRSAWKVIFEPYYSAIIHSKISRCTLLVLKHHQYSQNLGQLKEHLKGVKQIAGCLWEISAKCKCLLVTLDGCFHMPTGPCFHTTAEHQQQGKMVSKGSPSLLTVGKAWSTCKEAIFQLSGRWSLSSVTSWDNRPT